jgi:hypothetical protein
MFAHCLLSSFASRRYKYYGVVTQNRRLPAADRSKFATATLLAALCIPCVAPLSCACSPPVPT